MLKFTHLEPKWEPPNGTKWERVAELHVDPASICGVESDDGGIIILRFDGKDVHVDAEAGEALKRILEAKP